MSRFPCKIALRLKKVSYKVSLCKNRGLSAIADLLVQSYRITDIHSDRQMPPKTFPRRLISGWYGNYPVCGRRRGDELTALHIAVRDQLLAVVSILLSHGANVNSASRFDRRTPLQVAASTGNTDIMQLLVDNGAAVDQTDIYGATALHLTVVNGHLDAAEVSEGNI